jgi:hypothetical protein
MIILKRQEVRPIMNSNTPKYPKILAFLKKIELPMIFLSFIWFCILITELVNGTSPVLSGFGTGIWVLFILYFAMRMATVVNRTELLKQNWPFVLAILVIYTEVFSTFTVFSLSACFDSNFWYAGDLDFCFSCCWNAYPSSESWTSRYRLRACINICRVVCRGGRYAPF